MATRKLKTAAAVYVPQSKDACAADIARLGDLQRQRTVLQVRMNDAISQITQAAQPDLERLQGEIDGLMKAVQMWCEAHRAEITDNLRVKTANLITGEVTWRINTPKCSVRDEANVIATMKALGLQHYIRTAESINKEAVIATTLAGRTVTETDIAQDASKAKLRADAHALASVPGLTVVTGVEAFSVVPFEREVA